MVGGQPLQSDQRHAVADLTTVHEVQRFLEWPDGSADIFVLGLEAMNAILERLNAIAGEELQTDEQIEEAEKQLLAELDEDEEDDEEDLQLDEYGPVEDWNKGICA